LKLALGTVQFGLPYGIANRSGQVGFAQAAAILERAREAGVDTLDTAIAYGSSETCLGEIGIVEWQVVSKLPAIPDGCEDVAAWVHSCMDSSLNSLKIDKLHALLLHRPQELLGPSGHALHKAMLVQKDEGRVAKIGISIYGPEELEALAGHACLDLVQAPFSIVDRRLAASGWLARLHDGGTEIHTRSSFLQGLLLMEPDARPAQFARWQSLWDEWHRWLDWVGMTPLQACLSFALTQQQIDRVVVGVDSVEQLEEILAVAPGNEATFPESLASTDIQLLNPSNWNKS
jgi:hypothetical protein